MQLIFPRGDSLTKAYLDDLFYNAFSGTWLKTRFLSLHILLRAGFIHVETPYSCDEYGVYIWILHVLQSSKGRILEDDNFKKC